MNYYKKLLIILTAAFALFPAYSLAVCPVCTITVSAGIGLCRWLGVDDTISGTWIGGLIISSVIWFLNWLNKKQIRFKFRKILVSTFFYIIVVLPLYITEIIGHPHNKIWGFDKLLVGMFVGSITFLFSVLLHSFLKEKNQNEAFFPFQKVLIPILFLAITSIIFYYLTKC